jgi:hypothetical protein
MSQGKSKRINNRDARECVRERVPFEGSHLYARWTKGAIVNPRDVYVVYSYGPHWPLFVYDSAVGVWFENTETCTPTTSRHRSVAHPHVPTIACDHKTILRALRDGVNAILLRGEEE